MLRRLILFAFLFLILILFHLQLQIIDLRATSRIRGETIDILIKINARSFERINKNTLLIGKLYQT